MQIYYFSRTGTCEKVAKILEKILNLKAQKVKTYRLPYPVWLLLSFIPFIGIKTWFTPPQDEEIVFCFPKWTFNCPPATGFLKKIKCKTLYLIVCYGGWGEKHYEKVYRILISKYCIAEKVKVKFLKRKDVLEKEEEIKEDLSKFFEA